MVRKQDSGQPDPGSKGAPPLPARHEGPGDADIREGNTPDDDSDRRRDHKQDRPPSTDAW